MDEAQLRYVVYGVQEVIHAAIFEGSTPVMIITGTARQLNANTSPTRVWRQVPDDVKHILDVPAFETLPVHPDFEQRA